MKSKTVINFVDIKVNNDLKELPFLIYYRITNIRFGMDLHSHHGYELHFLHEGTGNYVVGQHVFPFQGNDFFLFDIQELHKVAPRPGTLYSRTVINFLPELLTPNSLKLIQDMLKLKDQPAARAQALDLGQHRQISSIIARMNEEYTSRQLGFEQIWGVLLNRLIPELYEALGHTVRRELPGSPSQHIVNEMIRYLTANYARSISLTELSERYHLTPYYLCHLFKKTTGETIRRFVQNIRLHRSKQELAFSDDSISEIAAKCGFNSYAFFSALFKKSEGMTPREYRKKCQKARRPGNPQHP